MRIGNNQHNKTEAPSEPNHPRLAQRGGVVIELQFLHFPTMHLRFQSNHMPYILCSYVMIGVREFPVDPLSQMYPLRPIL